MKIGSVVTAQRKRQLIRVLAVAIVVCLAAIYTVRVYQRNRLEAQAAASPDVKQIAAANNEFAFRLLHVLALKESNKNVFFSPYGIDNALAMIMNGTDGATHASMQTSLGLAATQTDRINSANSLVLRSLEDSNATININNEVWCNNGVSVRPQFKATLHKYYEADATSIDFASPDAPETINRAITKETDGHIRNVMTSSDLQKAGVVLTDCIYFKADWQDQFDGSDTHTDEFTFDGSGGKVRVPMMAHLFPKLEYMRSATYQAVCIPYDAKRYAMTIVLPNKGTTAVGLSATMDGTTWRHIMLSMKPDDVGLIMPRFNLDCNTDLQHPLSVLGMGSLFSDTADMSPMGSNAICVDSVKHQATLDVNEVGTLATAATTFGVIEKSMWIANRWVRANHPFICAIVDNLTGTILFLGVINNPAA